MNNSQDQGCKSSRVRLAEQETIPAIVRRVNLLWEFVAIYIELQNDEVLLAVVTVGVSTFK